MTELKFKNDVPAHFASKTVYNAKLVLIQLDQIKDICSELQNTILSLNQKVASLEEKLAVAKTSKNKD